MSIGSGISSAYSSGQLDKDIILFCKAILSLQENFPNFKVEIVCVAVNELQSLSSSNTTFNNNDNLNTVNDVNTLQSVQLILKKNLGSTVDFTVLRNSSMHFEEELRRLIAAHAPTAFMKLEFPPVNGKKINFCCFIIKPT